MFTTTLNSSARSCQAKRKHSRFVPALMGMLALCCFALLFTSPTQAQNIINTVAGGGTPPDLATQADLPAPAAVVEDASGNLYISAPDTYYIYKVTPAGSLSIYAGIGIYSAGGNNGPATQAGLAGVTALALDSAGDLYLADMGNNNIRCILAATGGCGGSALPVGDIVVIVDGNGQSCFPTTAACGDGGPAINAQISQAQGLFIDSANNIWLSDTFDFRIRCVVGTAGGCDEAIFGDSYPVGYILTVAGNGNFCDGPQFDCGNDGPALLAKFDLPSGVAVDASGNIYISDTRDFTVRCVVAVANGCGGSTQPVGNVTIFAGNGDYCPDPTKPCGDGGLAINANVWNTAGLSFDKAGDLYIADSSDNRIRCVLAVTRGCGGSPLAIGDITTVAGDGLQGYNGDGEKARSGWLNLPNGVFVDTKGNIFIADTGNQRIREVVSEHVSTVAGGGSNGDGGTATSATLANPNAVVWDSFGNYYIADAANNQIRCVVGVSGGCGGSAAVGTILAFAGTGIAGPPNATPVAAIGATLNNPEGIAVDANNDIYIADTGNQVIRCVLAVSGGCGGSTAAVGEIVTVAGDGFTCKPNNGPCGNGGPAIDGQLTEPTSVAIDSKGNMYIADRGAHRIRCVLGVAGGCGGSTYSVGDITNTAGTGEKGFSGNNGPAVKSKISRAYGVAVDSSGNVYIADSPNNQIRCVIEVAGGCGGSTYPVGDIVAFAFNSAQPSCHGDNGPALSATMNNPLELAIDPFNNVFVSGGSDNVVRRIDAASLTIKTVAGNYQHCAQSGFAGDGGPATLATLDNVGSAVDGKGDLLIADAGNNRVREVTLAPVATLSNKMLTFPTEPVGQSSLPMPVTLSNTGYADLPITGIQILGYDAGDFTISANTCGTQLAPSGNCSISVVFTPTKTGKRTAKLTITDSLGQQTVSLVGTGQ